MGTAPTLDATVTIKPVQCPVCKTFNPAGVMFCVDCGLIFDRALPDDAFGAPAVQMPVLMESNGREHVVRPGRNVVGREGDIAIPDPKVSRRHAEVTFNDGGFTVTDLGSTNGTTLNGEPVAGAVAFSPEDVVSFGGVEVRLRLPGVPSAGATQTIPSHRTAAMPAAPQVAPVAARLRVGDETFELRAGSNTFGRKDGNDIQIRDPYVSGKHGVLEVEEGGIYVTDLGSTNGTVVNDAKIPVQVRTRVTPDDVIRLGSLELRIEGL